MMKILQRMSTSANSYSLIPLLVLFHPVWLESRVIVVIVLSFR
jgi:hypothetical protein